MNILSTLGLGVALLAMFWLGMIVGRRLGFDHGVQATSVAVWMQCIDWAGLAMGGHPEWRDLKPADVLLKAGTTLAGEYARPSSMLEPPIEPSLLSRGAQV